MISGTDISCGVYQLSDLGNSAKRLIQEAWDHNEGGAEWAEEFIHLIFSDNTSRGRGDNLAQVIKTKKLGPIYTTRPRKNPNSTNNIKTWVWSVNWDKVEKYLK
jgi:hypothetical protein